MPAARAAIVLTGFVIFATRLLRLTTTHPDDPDTFLEKAIYFSFYAVVVAAAAMEHRRIFASLRAAPLLVGLHILAIASLGWSIDPGTSLSRLTALLGSSLFGVYVASVLPVARVMQLLVTGGVLTAAISFALIFLVPSSGIAQDGPWAGTWVGAYLHKNTMGEMSGLAALICILALGTPMRDRSLALLGLAANGVLLVMSKSLTAQLTFACCLLVALAPVAAVRGAFRSLMIAAVFLLPAIAIYADAFSAETLDTVLRGFGKDQSFSGRVPIWQNLLPYLRANFWLGSGYEAFWSDGNPVARKVVARLHFNPFDSHNGFVELWLSLGIVGVAAFLTLLWACVTNLAGRIRRGPVDAATRLAMVLLLLLCVQNVTESVILQRNSIVWVLFIVVDIWLARSALAARQPNPSQAPYCTPPAALHTAAE